MEEETHTCTICCSPDFPERAPCCDCDADPTTCVLLAAPPTAAVSKTSPSKFHGIGLAITVVILALIGAVMVGVALFYVATWVRQRTAVSYTPLSQSKRGDLSTTLALVEDSESGSEAELFARAGDT
jgi:hypothetical protein